MFAMNIRKAKTADLGQLAVFDTVTSGLDRRVEGIKAATIQGRCWVYAEGGMPMGYAIVQDDFLDYPFIKIVVVATEHRRKGIATKLVRHIETACGRDQIFTASARANTAMHKTLEAMGYLPCGEISDDVQTVVFLKKLVA